jgi:hypothetical protein
MRIPALWAQALPDVPTQWFTYILGPYGAVVVLLILLFLLLTQRPWGLIPRHHYLEMKAERDHYRDTNRHMIGGLIQGGHLTIQAVELAKKALTGDTP